MSLARSTPRPWGGGIGLVAVLIAYSALSAGVSAQTVGKRYELADLKALEGSFVALAEDVRPSVVAIRTYYAREPQHHEDPRIVIPVSQGSGFVIDPDGLIATNRHVLEDANSFAVILHTGQRYEATIQQADHRSDLAVLRIDAQDLKPVTWGKQADVRINQWSFACGNPFGLANDDGNTSITYGVVSALGRQMTDQLAVDRNMQYYGNLIETSSAISPGNSGGPLFNINGEVIGVVTAIATGSPVSEGHGYAIPADENTRRILETLADGKEVRYGFMGVVVVDVEPPQSRRVAHSQAHRGARITAINPADGPAAKAGLKRNDIIIAINGQPVESADHLVRLVGFSPAGTKIETTHLRRNVKRKTEVILADREEMLGVAAPE
ncbi:MAG: trypsin-like peptidase domain-containing protein [Phycisphaerales bacterium]|nr:MAG: trypsin-like peptidase domain-containing protein [Phycisphaerales bacterium]